MRQTQKSIPKIMNGMLTVRRGRLSSVCFILVFYEVWQALGNASVTLFHVVCDAVEDRLEIVESYFVAAQSGFAERRRRIFRREVSAFSAIT